MYAEKHQTNARYLFVPVFNLGNLTVGVGVLESIGTVLPRNRDLTFSVRFDMRFVQDSSKRRLVAVYDSPEDESVLLHMSETATSEPCTVTAMFSRAELRAIIHGKYGTPTSENLQVALQSFSHTSQNRSCTACSGMPGASCTCYVPPLPAPAHPYDMQHVKASLFQDVGAHMGVTRKIVFASGVPIRHLALGAHSVVEYLFDPKSVQELTEWSLRKSARSRREDPLQSLSLMGHREGTVSVGERQTRLQVVRAAEQSGTVSPEPGSLIDFRMGTNGRSPSDVVVTQGLEVSSLETSFQSFEQGTGDPGTIIRQGTVHCTATRNSEEVEASVLGIEENKNDTTQVQKTIKQGIPSLHEVAPQPALARRQETITSCKTPTVASQAHNSLQADGQQDVRLIMYKMKAEERKIRNRESAHRSNLKKKKKREEIRSELTDAQEKVNELREVEVTLRQENLRLRAAVEEET